MKIIQSLDLNVEHHQFESSIDKLKKEQKGKMCFEVKQKKLMK